MSAPFGSDASWKDCCYQDLLPPLHHAVWCASATACLAKHQTTLANWSRLNITSFFFFFARLLIAQIGPLIHFSIQLLRQHWHEGRTGAGSSSQAPQKPALPQRKSHSRAYEQQVDRPTAKGTVWKCHPIFARIWMMLSLKSILRQLIWIQCTFRYPLMSCCCYRVSQCL